jgi:hypothetical protein
VTRRVWLHRIAKATAALAIALALARFWPHEPLAQRMPLSTAVWSADGELLRVTARATTSIGCGCRSPAYPDAG